MDKLRFQTALINWFQRHKRDLPWRHTKDPYKIWLSEIMLQQTQVATVIPYYQRWLEKFPTLQSVADASEDKILKTWEGLGYYSRARNFHSACKEAISKYDGKVPEDIEEIQQLPGIGRYTAGAILSIAFNKPVPLVDGNVIRVLSRLFAIKKDPRRFQVLFWEQAEKLLFKKEPGTFNQALMELGATVCTPTNPSCLICPVNSFCLAKKQGIQEQLPLSPKRAKTQIVHLASALIRQNGKILLCQRKQPGHLKGMWEPPTVSFIPKKESAQRKIEDFINQWGAIEINTEEKPDVLKTSRTHYRLHFSAFRANIRGQSPSGTVPKIDSRTTNDERRATVLGYPTDLSSAEWIPRKDLASLPMPGAWAKFFKAELKGAK